jgi:hypothetical protein
MDVMELGAIGELVGGGAVVVSLIYVGLQIRAQTVESRLASLHSLNVAYGEYLDSFIENREAREVYLQGLRDFEALNPQERMLFGSCLGKIFRYYESAFHQWRAGRIDDDYWHTFDQPAADLLGYPGLQAWWATRSRWFGERFQAHVASLIERGGGQAPYPIE